MRVNPISYNANYFANKVVYFGQNSTKVIPRDKNKAATKTSDPAHLSSYITLMNNKMNVDANIRFFVSGLCKIDSDTKRKNEPIEIADIGCCDGALCRKLYEFLPPNAKYYGLDLSQDMINCAIDKDKQIGRKNSFYTVGNAFNLPYKENSKDAIILSSIMHELYSYADKEYNEEAYSKESILHFMQNAYKCLKPGGVLIIKDPATAALDAWEPIKIANANKKDGEIPVIKDEEKLRNADITKLSTYDKLRRFTMDFYPAQNNIKWDENGDCIMPRWLVTEWVRHRKWLATPENWAYEIKENYGTLRPDELSDFAKKIGYSIVKVENISLPDENNIYKIKENEFEIKDMDGNILSLQDFPMFIEAVLRKPREYTKIFK